MAWVRLDGISGGYFYPEDAAVRKWTGAGTGKAWENGGGSIYPHARRRARASSAGYEMRPRKWTASGIPTIWALSSAYKGYPHPKTKYEREFPSSAYRAAVRAAARESRLSGTITLNDGGVVRFTDGEIAQGSLVVTANAMQSDYLLPGAAACAELTVTLYTEIDAARLAGAEIAPVFEVRLGKERWYPVPLGVFTAVLPEDDSETGIAVTARDDMHRLEAIEVTALGIEDGRGYTPQEVIELCGAAAGLVCADDVTDYANGDAVITLSDAQSKIETARDLLAYTAQTVCAVAYIDRWRRLRVRPIRTEQPVVTYGKNNRKSLRHTLADYHLRKLFTTEEVTNPDGSITVTRQRYTTLYADGVDAELPENPLLPASTDCKMSETVAALDTVTHIPLTAETFGDPTVELLDWIGLTDTKLGDFQSPVTSYEWRYHGGEMLTSCGTEAVTGAMRTAAEKAALAARTGAAQSTENIARETAVLTFRGGHEALSFYTHQELSHFTHRELSSKEEVQAQ